MRKAALTGQLNPGALSPHNQQRLDQILDQLDDDGTDAQPTNNPPQPIRERPRREPSCSNSHGTTAPMRHADDFFGPNTILLAYFKHFRHPLRVNIAGDDELFIGRKTANSAMAPDIDLNPVNAGDYGVSRMHAVITRRDNKLLIADLESLNYTYVNGMRLLPEEYYVLKDGDEIWFAQLHCRIRFQHK